MLMTSLDRELNKVLPKENVLLTPEERYVYSFDASVTKETKNIADAVVFPRDINDVVNIVKIANKTNTPIICRGAGTNTVGACVPINRGIIVNFSLMNKILEINQQNMTAKVQPGVTIGELQSEVEKIGLFYPPDPSNLKVSTIGGSIAQNSAGARCFKYGATKDYVIDMLVVMSSGEIIRTGSNTIKNSAGYNLGSLFIGSEGTLGIVVEATVKLIPKPQSRRVIMAYFDTIEDAITSVNNIISEKLFPSTVDFMDKNALQTVEKFYPTGLLCNKEAALLVEIDGEKSYLEAQRQIICDIFKSHNCTYLQYSSSDKESDEIWTARRSSMAACAKLKPNVTTDDVIVPRQNLAKLVKGIQEICTRHNLLPCLVGHVGDGSIHPQIPIDISNEKEYQAYKLAKSEIYQLTIKLGGTISGEHGIGLEKRPYLPRVVEKGTLEYMRQIKKIFDPNNILNPYKIF